MASNETRILVEGRNCWKILPAARTAFLIDAASYFAAFRQAVKRAERSVLIAGWDFDSRIQLIRHGPSDELPARLGEFLNAVVATRPELQVHILIWDSSLIYALEREPFPIFARDGPPHPRLHFRLDRRHPFGGSHHQKIVVVDDKVAFAGGIDLGRERWDTRKHHPEDPRRVEPDGRIYPPYHDVHVAVDGPAAAALGELVRERWRRATGQRLSVPATASEDPWPSALKPHLRQSEVAIARTEPAYRGNHEVREVETLYHDAILASKKYIYIENQFFTCAAVAAALAARLNEKNGPEVLIVLPLKRRGWIEEYTMGLLRSRLVRKLRNEDRFGRLRIFYPHVEGLKAECENVHAKVMIIDDSFLRVGSANLNNRSMGLDTECDLALEARGEPRIMRAISHVRDCLLADHFGSEVEEVSAVIEAQSSLIRGIEKLRERQSGHTLEPLRLVAPQWMDSFRGATFVLDPVRPLTPGVFASRIFSEEGRKLTARHYRGIILPLLLLVWVAGAWKWVPLAPLTDWESEGLAGLFAGSLLSSAIILAGYVLGTLLFLPVTVLIFLTAMLLEPAIGFVYALVGSHLAALVLFGVGRVSRLGSAGISTGHPLQRLFRRLDQQGAGALLGAPFAVINIAAGAAHMRLRQFLMCTLFGMAPGILAIVVLANRLKIFLREPSARNYGAFLASALLILVGLVLIHRLFGRRGKSGGGAVTNAGG